MCLFQERWRSGTKTKKQGTTRDTITIYYIQEWSVRDHKERVELIYSPYVLLGGNLAHSAFWNVTPDIVLASFDLDGANFQRTTH